MIAVNDALKLIARAKEHLKIMGDEDVDPEQCIADTISLLNEAVDKLAEGST